MSDVRNLKINGTTYVIGASNIVNNNSSKVNSKLKLWTGTTNEFNAITNKDADTFYTLTDTGLLYLGNTQVCPTDDKVDRDLSNLSAEGEGRLHALKSYLDEGELLTDAEGLADVTKYAHSTFDASKVGTTGTPIIKNGSLNIISGTALNFSSSNYLTLPSFTISGAWKATYKFNLISLTADVPLLVGGQDRIDINTSGKVVITASGSSISLLNNGAITTGTSYLLIVSYDGSSTYKAILINLSNNTMVDDSGTLASTMTNVSRTWYIGSDTSATKYLNGSFILSGFSLITGGSSVNASQTGTDTYTISGSTVTIPYTLSKTGSKIVDSTYRAQVSAVYNAYGCAPYYTLNEGVNFTLPQGEIYGMVGNSSTKWTFVSSALQTLSTSTAIGTYRIDLSTILPNDGYTYECIFTYVITSYHSSNQNSKYTVTIDNVDYLFDQVDSGSSDAKTMGGQFIGIAKSDSIMDIAIATYKLHSDTYLKILAYRKADN